MIDEIVNLISSFCACMRDEDEDGVVVEMASYVIELPEYAY